MDTSSHWGRSRWAAIGAAVAVTIGAGGIAITNAAGGTGVPSAFVPITPCRLFDTRADSTVGPRSSPLKTGETYVQQVTGTNGNCTVPAGAAGVAFNVTIVNGSAASYLTVWPSDATRPLASSLNWVAGTPAIPNKVDVRLSPDGKVSLFDNNGSVDVLADIVGYYIALPAVPPPTGVAGHIRLDAARFSSDGAVAGDILTHSFADGSIGGVSLNPVCGIAQAELPDGVTVTGVVAHVFDDNANPGFDVTVKLWRNPLGIESPEVMFAKSTAPNTAPGNFTLTGGAVTSPLVDNAQNSYFATVCGLGGLNRLYDMDITYTS
jgi:hypothetical protein